MLLGENELLPFHHLYQMMLERSIVCVMLYCTTLHRAVLYSAVLCSTEDNGAPLCCLDGELTARDPCQSVSAAVAVTANLSSRPYPSTSGDNALTSNLLR